MNKIRKGDEVVVITGREKGRRGTVIKVLPNERVLVENVNMVKRHTRPNPQRGIQGGIVEKEASLHLSNVMLWNPIAKKGDRVGIFMNKSLDSAVAIYGIMKAGGAYLPLDPDYPAERLGFMVRDAGVRFLVTQAGADLAGIDPEVLARYREFRQIWETAPNPQAAEAAISNAGLGDSYFCYCAFGCSER